MSRFASNAAHRSRIAIDPMSTTQIWTLVAILSVSLLLRAWGAFADLPYILHPDEPVNLQIIQGMLTTHDANPHAFLYPSFQYYINVVAAIVFVVVPHWIAGTPVEFLPPLSIAMGSTFAPDPASVELYRSVSIFSGVLSVFLIFRIGLRASGVRVGLGAALLAALCPLLVDDCRHVTPDSYVVLFELVTILASFAIVATGNLSAYVAAGLAIGFTAASKYNGAIVCLFPIVAHVVRWKFALAALPRLVAAGFISALTFAVVCPYILIDHSQFVNDLLYQGNTYASTHAGMEGNTASWYLLEILRGTGVAAVFAALQIVIGMRKRDVFTIILAGFTIAYFVFIASFQIRNDRTLLPIIPCVLILAVLYFEQVRSAGSALSRISPSLRMLLLVVCGTAMVIGPLYTTVSYAMQLHHIDSRTTAREWINSNLPPGSIVAVESYSPYADPNRFQIVRTERAIDHPLSWYGEQGVDYVVISQTMYGRYFVAPFSHLADTARYVAMMDQFKLVKRFTDGGLEVLIYQVVSAGKETIPLTP